VKGKIVLRHRRVAPVVALACALLAAVATTAVASLSAKAPPKQPSAAQWQALIAKAKAEGSVTLYTGQAPLVVANMAAKFKDKYGISVNINRQVDNVLAAQVTAEHGTGRHNADIWVSSAKRLVLGALENGWVVDALAPNVFNTRYNRKVYTLGKANIIGLSLLGMAWNTKLVPQPLKDIPDFLTPAFANGKLGVFNPSISAAAMDWYLWAQRTYGANFLTRLAAQRPKIYLSTLPMTQAIESGEIYGAPMAAGTALIDKANGAPIEYIIPNKGNGWNVPLYAMILKKAQHPAASQLLIDYMLSTEGQAAMNEGYGAVYRGLRGTFYAPPNDVKLSDYTPAKIAAFQAKWNEMFGK
jgi:iron(III) transport system substrate-binding protein